MSRSPPRTRAPLDVHTFQVGEERFAIIALPIETDASPLTAAEHRVALEVLAGRSNAEIATALGISTRTVATHVARMFRKLGVGSRAELAAKLAPLETRKR